MAKKQKPVRFNEKRAAEVFPMLAQAWRNRKGFLGEVVLPEERYLNYMPDDKEEIARLLFYSAHFMRGGINSDDPFLTIMVLHRLYPDLFIPESVTSNWDQERIVKAFKVASRIVLKGKGTGKKDAGALGYKLEEHAKYWWLNSQLLVNNWEGSVISVFRGTACLLEAYKRMLKTRRRFYGMRLKIMSLLAMWLQARGVLPCDGKPFSETRPYPTTFPVDFHMLRFLYSQEVIRFRNMRPFDAELLNTSKPGMKKELSALNGKPSVRVTEPVTDCISVWSDRMMDILGINEADVAVPIWFWSRNLCAGSIQNNTKTNRDKASDTKEVIFFDKETLLSRPEIRPVHYSDPCQRCDFNIGCKSSSPSRVYYKVGQMVFLRRVDYPRQQGIIPGFEEHHYPFTAMKIGRNRNGFHFLDLSLEQLRAEEKEAEDIVDQLKTPTTKPEEEVLQNFLFL